eukprot:366543-Chlamydomonas_euryale.AAC.2
MHIDAFSRVPGLADRKHEAHGTQIPDRSAAGSADSYSSLAAGGKPCTQLGAASCARLGDCYIGNNVSRKCTKVTWRHLSQEFLLDPTAEPHQTRSDLTPLPRSSEGTVQPAYMQPPCQPLYLSNA